MARRHGLPVHMDGARFANALVQARLHACRGNLEVRHRCTVLGRHQERARCAPRPWCFSTPSRAREFERRRKRGGHLWSKDAIPKCAVCSPISSTTCGCRNARHANAMAAALSAGLRTIAGASLAQSVDANEVFVVLSERVVSALEKQGFRLFIDGRCVRPRNGVAIRFGDLLCDAAGACG